MSDYPHWSQSDSNEKGPFPLVASLNGELQLNGIERAYHTTLLKNELGARALLPIVLEISVPKLQGSDIPEQFAKAHDAIIAPVSRDFADLTQKQYRGPETGSVCILPEPINLGISTIVLWQKQSQTDWRPDLRWHIDTLTLLSDEQTAPLGIVEGTTRRIPRLGRLISEMPRLSDDLYFQDHFEDTIEDQRRTIPESLDTTEEIAPGVWEVEIRDGKSLETHDYLTCSSFVKAAKGVSTYNPGFAKTTFAALAHHIANGQLASAYRHQPDEARRIANRVSVIRQSLYWVTATEISPTNPSRQIGLDYETVRSVALQLIDGSLKLEGVGDKSVAFLKSMFDPA